MNSLSIVTSCINMLHTCICAHNYGKIRTFICFQKLKKTCSHLLALVQMEGVPSNTTTRSARYVAMMKSCSTTKAVFLACNTNLSNTAQGHDKINQ